MSVRSGIAEVRRELQVLRDGVGGLTGLAERMRRVRAAVDAVAPPTLEEIVESSPLDSLRHKMAAQALRMQKNYRGLEQ